MPIMVARGDLEVESMKIVPLWQKKCGRHVKIACKTLIIGYQRMKVMIVTTSNPQTPMMLRMLFY